VPETHNHTAVAASPSNAPSPASNSSTSLSSSQNETLATAKQANSSSQATAYSSVAQAKSLKKEEAKEEVGDLDDEDLIGSFIKSAKAGNEIEHAPSFLSKQIEVNQEADAEAEQASP